MLTLLIAVHVLAAVYWVGGMAFAYTVLRPAAGPLEPPARLALWRRVFLRFLPWVGASVAALLASGVWATFLAYGRYGAAPAHVHLMAGLGVVMAAVYLYLLLGPWPRFRRAVEAGAWPEAGGHLNAIRRLVVVNLSLGVVTVLVGGTGRFW